MSEKQVKVEMGTVVDEKTSEASGIDSMKMGRDDQQKQETSKRHYPKTSLSPMELEYALARPA